MDLRQELQNQKFYDLLQQSGGQSASATIELIMRTLDQEDITVTHNTHQGFNGSSQTLEVDPNVILQTFNIGTGTTDPGEESSSSSGDRPHICQLCQASYKTRTHLRRHMVIHLNNRPYPCECGKGFNRKEHLTKHIEAVHSGTKYKCQFCAKEISRKDHLSRHIKNMHPNYSISTSTLSVNMKDGSDPSIIKVQLPCGQKQKAQLSFLTPGGTSSSPATSFASTVVGQTLITPVTTAASTPAYNATLNGKSNKSTNSTTGGACSNSKSQSSSVQSSISSSDTEESPTQIILDSTSFQQLALLPGSIVIPTSNSSSSGTGTAAAANQEKQNTSTTKLQNLSNQNQNGLLGLTNLSITLGGQIREAPFANCGDNKKMTIQIFQCSECSASFTCEKDLGIHLRSHKPQNYRCSECPRAYTRREKLTEHIRCFHQGQKFKCEHCGKELSRKDHVLRHVRSIHPEVLASRFTAVTEQQENSSMNGENRLQQSNSGGGGGQNSRSSSSTINEMGVLLRSICQYCLKIFGTSYHLSRHIESCHNGDIRPYSCTSCSKQFKRKDHLTKHMKSHCPNIRDGNHNQNPSSTTTPHARKSLPNLNKIKMESNGSPCLNQQQQQDSIIKVEKSNRMKSVENGNLGGKEKKDRDLMDNDGVDVEDNNEEDSDASDEEDMDINENEPEEDIHMDNLAMINSFIAENVNVVVEEDLSSLLENPHEQHSNSHLTLSLSHNSRSERKASHSSSSHNITATFPCGHCQKEFPSRDQLLDHLQEHTNEDLQQHEHNRNDMNKGELIQFNNF